MNISIVISSIIGGILIIAIAALNFRMSESAGSNTLYNMSKNRMDAITEMVTYDIRKMGYRSDPAGPVFVSAGKHEFSFYADIDNDGFANLVTWRYDTTAVIESTPNPNDHMLIREVLMEDGSVDEIEMSLVVTKFEFTYFNAVNDTIDPVTEPNQLHRIRLSINTESEFPYGDRYARSAWERTFTPRNLNM